MYHHEWGRRNVGLYAHHTRGTGTVLTGDWSGAVTGTSTEDVFNGDHQNHVVHTDPTFINSFEDTQPHMDIETNPMPGTPPAFSLPAALSDELERIRFVLKAIKTVIQSGTVPAHWYIPTLTNASVVTFPPTAARYNLVGLSVPPNVETSPFFQQPAVYDSTSGNFVSPRGTPAALTPPVAGIYLIGATVQWTDPIENDSRLTLLRTNSDSSVDRLATDENTSTVRTVQILNVGTVAHFGTPTAMAPAVFHTDPSSRTLASGAVWMALLARTVT
jgi:hypothetical protein